VTEELSNSATQQLSNSATQQLSNSATQQLSLQEKVQEKGDRFIFYATTKINPSPFGRRKTK
jgi:adenine-specific DNA-methyltransferase